MQVAILGTSSLVGMRLLHMLDEAPMHDVTVRLFAQFRYQERFQNKLTTVAGMEDFDPTDYDIIVNLSRPNIHITPNSRYKVLTADFDPLAYRLNELTHDPIDVHMMCSVSSFGKIALQKFGHEIKHIQIEEEHKPAFDRPLVDNVLLNLPELHLYRNAIYKTLKQPRQVQCVLVPVRIGNTAFVTIYATDPEPLLELIREELIVVEGSRQYVSPRDSMHEWVIFANDLHVAGAKISFLATYDNLFATARILFEQLAHAGVVQDRDHCNAEACC